MNKKEKIGKNREYKRIYNRGKSMVSPLVITYVLKNRSNTTRVGITTGKRIGNAVKRNRARRVIRESFYSLRKKIKKGYDLIFVARSRTSKVKMNYVLRDITFHLEKMGVIG